MIGSSLRNERSHWTAKLHTALSLAIYITSGEYYWTLNARTGTVRPMTECQVYDGRR